MDATRRCLSHEAADRIALEIVRKATGVVNDEEDAKTRAKIYNKAYGTVFDYVQVKLEELE